MNLFLDDTRQVYFPGTTIDGTLCVKSDVDSNHKPIIKAHGYTCIWKSSSCKETEEYTQFYEDEAILTPEEDNINLSLNEFRGYSKIFKFYLVLPNNLPPSHEVPFGHTRYKLEAHYNGKTVYKYISVNQWVGLKKRNDNIVKHERFNISLIHFCRPIEVILNLNQTHYLPGETIYVEAITTNNSWEDVIFSKIFILQTTKYWKAHHLLPIKYTRVIAEGIRGLLPSGCSQIWEKEPLYIPAVIPTTNTSNNPFNFFEVKYKIKIQIVLKNLKKRYMLKQKLFIGNWDKSKILINNQNTSSSKINEPLYQITAQDCVPIKLENIDFIPKYTIYETSQE